MISVRAVRIDDLDDLLKLVRSATRGLTSLQLNREQLLDRIEQSVFALSRTGISLRDEPYVLVMIDDTAGEIVGTSTIYAKTGGHQPFYAYQIRASDHHCDQLDISQHRKRLEIYRTHDGPTEIGSLFLRGKYRGGGRGRWLSLARFMLIAMRPHRFSETVIAEMRGRAMPDGSVPFWDAVTGRFIPVEFAKADAMSTVSKDFIESMMPQHPIYLDLLPAEIRQGLGEVHDETQPALGLLKSEGFRKTDLIDIFDAGPVVECDTNRIGAVARCRETIVGDIVDAGKPPDDTAVQDVILASKHDGFTSVLTRATIREERIDVLAKDAVTLGIEKGAGCWTLTPRASR
ncbi:Arginine N-succinyltransferase subunit beta [Rubripirellula tenax]|uniref:Arginine N-succinyltransferase subunit beta n=1 Tax=Rubripirellula tenax TaxID=2528015 RepID=A0A5C6F8V6_9BACT|nr:arginine N-succinyltransferase [Rubripirellula tenax]TWU56827.1 Arginine N-succinyltransferase subunit beta [Rubripirellula tenax]